MRLSKKSILPSITFSGVTLLSSGAGIGSKNGGSAGNAGAFGSSTFAGADALAVPVAAPVAAPVDVGAPFPPGLSSGQPVRAIRHDDIKAAVSRRDFMAGQHSGVAPAVSRNWQTSPPDEGGSDEAGSLSPHRKISAPTREPSAFFRSAAR